MRSIEYLFDHFSDVEADMETVAGQRMAPLRLTARGRALVRCVSGFGAAALMALLVLGGVALLGGSAQASGSVQAVPVAYHVVAPGETLWALAAEVDPHADPRDVVQALIELNGLTTANVTVGTRLALPRR